MLQKFFLAQAITIFNDAPQPWQIGFQDSAAPGFTGIVELHNTIFFYLVVISVGVFWVLGSIIYYYNYKKSPIVHKYLNHGLKAQRLKRSIQKKNYSTSLATARLPHGYRTATARLPHGYRTAAQQIKGEGAPGRRTFFYFYCPLLPYGQA